MPSEYPTITQQVSAFTGDKSSVDLILIDGGINDTKLENILSPGATIDLVQLTEDFCHKDLSDLLYKVADEFPKAKIIVTGYYQIVSNDSDLTRLAMLLVGVGVVLAGLPGGMLAGGYLTPLAKQIMVNRSKVFADQSQIKIAQAVQEVNTNPKYLGRVAFAQPNFGPRNAIFAPDAWLWGLESDLSPCDHAHDGGVEVERASACALAGNRAPLHCGIASIGHPNVEGAKEYARVIKALL